MTMINSGSKGLRFAIVCDAGPIIKQHLVNGSSLLGEYISITGVKLAGQGTLIWYKCRYIITMKPTCMWSAIFYGSAFN